MILKAYSVYDSKGEMFNLPFFQHNAGLALRMFADLVNDPNSQLFRHPLDFVLYEIGTFDDSSGGLIPYQTHVHLGVASQFKETRPAMPSLAEMTTIKNGEAH